jgi:molybdopterin/thiamine biosynthesis adenylyltransferase
MKTRYKGILFLKDNSDLKLLKNGRFLYGQAIESTKLFFLTPYKPPTENTKKIGVVQKKSEKNHDGQVPVSISYSRGRITGRTLLNNRWVKFPVSIVFSSAMYARTPFKRTEMDHLSNKKILLFGCGTGGGKIAKELAKAGLYHITLCDPDRLEVANVSRHEGDLLDVGKYKAHLVAEHIYRINPSIKVVCYSEDILKRKYAFVKALFELHDLVIAATDVTSVQFSINELVQQTKVPCVFGGCFEEARGGEVFFTLPDENTPCLCCLRGGLAQPERKGSIDYSTASGPEDYQGQPGLHAMVDFITCAEVLICLAILLREIPGSELGRLIDPKRNFLLIGGALGEGFYRFKKPFDVFFQPLTGARKNCKVCQKIELSEILST